jgi:MYXO-CTERM domain-containing protein
MVSEEVVFLEPGTPPAETTADAAAVDGRWRVRAAYVFENLTDRAIALTMVFPMDVLRPDCDQYFSEHVPPGESLPEEPPDGGWSRYAATPPITASDFRVTVDGRLVSSSLERDIRPRPGWEYPFGYSFPVAFAPNARLEMTCEYLQATSEVYEYVATEERDEPPYEHVVYDGRTTVPFVLESGGLWAGTIERVDLLYRFAGPLREIWYDETEIQPGRGVLAGEHFDVFRWELACADGRSELRIRARDVNPWIDLLLQFHPDGRWIECAEGQVVAAPDEPEAGDSVPHPVGAPGPEAVEADAGETATMSGAAPEPPPPVSPRRGAGCACAATASPDAGSAPGWPLAFAGWAVARRRRRTLRSARGSPTASPRNAIGRDLP